MTTPDGDPGLNYLCPAYKRFFTHVGPAVEVMARLWREERLSALVMDLMVEIDKDRPQRLNATLDQLRARYGRRTVMPPHGDFFGGVQESRDNSPMRVSFTHTPDSDSVILGSDPSEATLLE